MTREDFRETQNFYLVWNNRWKLTSQRSSKSSQEKAKSEKEGGKILIRKISFVEFIVFIFWIFSPALWLSLPYSTNINSLSSSMSPLDMHSYPYLFNHLIGFLIAAAQAVHCTTPEEKHSTQTNVQMASPGVTFILWTSEHDLVKPSVAQRILIIGITLQNTPFLRYLWYHIIIVISFHCFQIRLFWPSTFLLWMTVSIFQIPKASALSTFSYNYM